MQSLDEGEELIRTGVGVEGVGAEGDGRLSGREVWKGGQEPGTPSVVGVPQ